MIKLFNEKKIEEAFNIVLQNAQKRIDRLSDNEILDSDLDQISENISQNFQIDKLVIDLNNRKVNTVMSDVLGSWFPPGTDVRPDQYYSCAKVNYTFSIQSGDVELLSVKPSKTSFNHNVGAEINNNQFTIGYQTRYANLNLSDQVKQEVKQGITPIIDSIRQVIDTINDEIANFNGQLKNKIINVLENKRKEIQKRNEQNDDLNNL